MSNETVGISREALERWRASFAAWDNSTSNRMAAEIDTILAQPVASEPVVWMYSSHRGTDLVRNRWSDDMRKMGPHDMTETPLYRHPSAPAIPEGYALVPIEPTEVMRDAGNIYTLNRATLMRIWADMLDAAQQPTKGSTDD